MDARTILAILEKDESDESVAQANQWIRAKKSTNKSAEKILVKLISLPNFQLDYAWLETWIEGSQWRFLDEPKIRNMRHLDWVLEILNDNPDDHRTPSVWRNLISQVRNPEVFENFLAWFISHEVSEEFLSSIAITLLNYNLSADVIDKIITATENLKLYMAESLLIEKAHHQPAIDRALATIKTSSDYFETECLATALLKCNFDKYFDSVERCLSAWYKDENSWVHILNLSQIDARCDSFVIHWLEHNTKSSVFDNLLFGALECHPSKRLTQLAWEWTKSKENHGGYIFHLTRLLIFSKELCPDAARETAQKWLEENLYHGSWKMLASAYWTAKKGNRPYNLGLQAIKMLGADVASSFINDMILENTNNRASELAQEWLPWAIANRFSRELTVTIYAKTRNEDVLKLISEKFVDIHNKIDARTMQLLLSAKLTEFTAVATDLVSSRYLVSCWGFAHQERGSVIKELLVLDPTNLSTIAAAENWLKVPIHTHEKKLYNEINAMLRRQGEK